MCTRLSIILYRPAMTHFRIDGKRGASCHKVLEDCGLLSEEYHTNAKALQAKYYPIEIDPNCPLEEKKACMLEWTNRAHELLVRSALTRSSLIKAVETALAERRIILRQGVEECFDSLAKHDIPVLIFSAGIYDVLANVLRISLGEISPLVHIVSNRCVFSEDQNAILSGFEDPTIHVFNKKSASFLETPFFTATDEASRPHVILIGDSVGDISMIEGMSHNSETLLKIGFLNDAVESRLQQYLDLYDIVIVGDPSFDVPRRIIEKICSDA